MTELEINFKILLKKQSPKKYLRKIIRDTRKPNMLTFLSAFIIKEM